MNNDCDPNFDYDAPGAAGVAAWVRWNSKQGIRAALDGEEAGLLVAEFDRLRAVADAAEAIYHQHHTAEGLQPEDPEWAKLGAALAELGGQS